MYYLYGLEILLATFLLALLFWANKAKPKKETIAKYPRRLFLQSTSPFYYSWKTQVKEPDASEFFLFRKRIFVCIVATILVFSFFAMITANFKYLYNHVIPHENVGVRLR